MNPAQVVDGSCPVRPARARPHGYPSGRQVAPGGESRRQSEVRRLQRRRGRPGAFMDRSVSRATPTASSRGWPSPGTPSGPRGRLHLRRGEYGLAVQRLQTAIRQAERAGLLGSRYLSTALQLPGGHPDGRGRVRLRRRRVGAPGPGRQRPGPTAPLRRLPNAQHRCSSCNVSCLHLAHPLVVGLNVYRKTV